jgi:hypothetical protein
MELLFVDMKLCAETNCWVRDSPQWLKLVESFAPPSQFYPDRSMFFRIGQRIQISLIHTEQYAERFQ